MGVYLTDVLVILVLCLLAWAANVAGLRLRRWVIARLKARADPEGAPVERKLEWGRVASPPAAGIPAGGEPQQQGGFVRFRPRQGRRGS